MTFDINIRLARICATIEANEDDEELHVVMTTGDNVAKAYSTIREDNIVNSVVAINNQHGISTLESLIARWTSEQEEKKRVLVVDMELASRLNEADLLLENDRDVVNYHLCADPAIVLGARYDQVKLLAADATSSSSFTGFTNDQRENLKTWAKFGKKDLSGLQARWKKAVSNDDEDNEDCEPDLRRAKVAAVSKAAPVETIEFPRFVPAHGAPTEVMLQANAHRLCVLGRTQMVTELGSRVIILTESAATAMWFRNELKALKVDVAAFTNVQNPAQRRAELENFNTGSVSVLIAPSSLILNGVRLAIPTGLPLEVHSTYPMHEAAASRNIQRISGANRCSEIENWLWTRKDPNCHDVAISPLVIKEARAVKSASEAAEAAVRERDEQRRLAEAHSNLCRQAVVERDDLLNEVRALRAQIGNLTVTQSPTDQIRAQAAGAAEVGMTGHQFGRLLDYTSALEKIVNRVASKPYLENDIASAALLGQQCVEDAKPSN